MILALSMGIAAVARAMSELNTALRSLTRPGPQGSFLGSFSDFLDMLRIRAFDFVMSIAAAPAHMFRLPTLKQVSAAGRDVIDFLVDRFEARRPRISAARGI